MEENWFNMLKEGGTITSGKAGITNVTYGKKRKKSEEEKEEETIDEFPIVPKEQDFFRKRQGHRVKLKNKKFGKHVIDILNESNRPLSAAEVLSLLKPKIKNVPTQRQLTAFLRVLDGVQIEEGRPKDKLMPDKSGNRINLYSLGDAE